MTTDDLPERMSRWAAGITAGFLALLWPAIAFSASVWNCPGSCRTSHGRNIVLAGVAALLLAPIAALLFMLSRRIRRRGGPVAVALAAAALVTAMAAWAWASGALLEDMGGPAVAANAFVLAAVMAVYCASVVGGSWMSAVGLHKLESDE